MTRRRLPIGIQDFRRLRETDCYYVDKTPLVRDLVERSDHCFLSRPRRFGKSLLLDTLRSLFGCREGLFRGLGIHGHWDWAAPRPVVRLSFGGKYGGPGEIEGDVIEQLEATERRHGLPPAPASDTGPRRLRNILDRLHHASGRQVAVLVDEYDRPILDALHDPGLATANRDYLRGLYGIVKGSAEHVRFTFVTGVSMFSKVSLFPGLNNLEDISLDPRYATICGYTDGDLDRTFAPELGGLDRDGIRAWYNGYHWLGGERVYNPYGVLLLLDGREFRPWWFETGSPAFLFRTLVERSVGPMELENRMADRSLVSRFDVDDIGVEALLFQTGYLTIAEELGDGLDTLYRLDYPNLEVRTSLNGGLLRHLGKGRVPLDDGRELRALLGANDFAGFADRLRSCLSAIPYQWHATGDLARYEAWYASLLHMCLSALGVDLRVEDASSHGRADMAVLTGGQVFVLEFRMAEGDGDAEAALAQMRGRGYADRWRGRGEPVHLIGVACGRGARNVLAVRAAYRNSRQWDSGPVSGVARASASDSGGIRACGSVRRRSGGKRGCVAGLPRAAAATVRTARRRPGPPPRARGSGQGGGSASRGPGSRESTSGRRPRSGRWGTRASPSWRAPWSGAAFRARSRSRSGGPGSPACRGPVPGAPAGAGGAHGRHGAAAVHGKVGDPGEPLPFPPAPVGRAVRAAVAPRDAFPPGDRLPASGDAGPDVGTGGAGRRAVQAAQFVPGAVGVGEPDRACAGFRAGDGAEAVPPQAGDAGSVGGGAVLRDDGLQAPTLPPEAVDGTRRGVAPAAVPPVPAGPGDRLRGQRRRLAAFRMADHGGGRAAGVAPRPVTVAGDAAVVAVDGPRAGWPAPPTGIRRWPSKAGWPSSALPRRSLADRVLKAGGGRLGPAVPGRLRMGGRRAPPRSRTASGGSRGRWRSCGCPCRTAGATDIWREHRKRRHEVVPGAGPPPVHRTGGPAEAFRQRPGRPGPAGVLPEPHRPSSRQ